MLFGKPVSTFPDHALVPAGDDVARFLLLDHALCLHASAAVRAAHICDFVCTWAATVLGCELKGMAASACRTAIPLDRTPTVTRAVRRIARIAAPSSMGTAVRMRQSPESVWCARLYRKSSSRLGGEGCCLHGRGERSPPAASAPRRLSQYEFDLVARDADIPQLAVGQLRQRAPLPRELGPGPPGAHLTPHRPLPQRFERTPGSVQRDTRGCARSVARRGVPVRAATPSAKQHCRDRFAEGP